MKAWVRADVGACGRGGVKACVRADVGVRVLVGLGLWVPVGRAGLRPEGLPLTT